MKKKTKVLLVMASAMLIAGLVIGGIVLTSIHFDFTRLSTVDPAEYTEESMMLEGNESIELKLYTDDVSIGVSTDNRMHISYYSSEAKQYQLSQENGTVKINSTQQNVVQGWYERFTKFDFSSTEKGVTILLPEDFSGGISTSITTGDIRIEGICADSISIKGTTGEVTIEQVEVAKDIIVNTVTGRAKLNHVLAYGTISSSNTTGDLALSDVVCQKLKAACTTGRITLSRLDAEHTEISTTTGTVYGDVKGKQEDYSIISNTITGDNNLPERWGSGKRTIEISTGVGRIDVSFE